MGCAEQVDHCPPRCAGDWVLYLPELDRQLLCLQLDADDVVADEVAVITFCPIREMLAHGGCDARLDFGRRHPAHGSGTRRLPMEEG